MEARFSQSRSWRPQPVSEGKVKDPPQGQNSSSYMPLLYGPGGGDRSRFLTSNFLFAGALRRAVTFPILSSNFLVRKPYGSPEKGYSVQLSHHS